MDVHDMKHFVISEDGSIAASTAAQECFQNPSLAREHSPIPNGTGGYMRLAEHMGQHSNRAIYRRFGGLNALNLLYLQAELVKLEKALRAEATKDVKSELRSDQCRALDWSELVKASAGGSNCVQWNIMLNIRKVLQEYSKYVFGCSFSEPEH